MAIHCMEPLKSLGTTVLCFVKRNLNTGKRSLIRPGVAKLQPSDRMQPARALFEGAGQPHVHDLESM